MQNTLLRGDHCYGSNSRHVYREVIVTPILWNYAIFFACALRGNMRRRSAVFVLGEPSNFADRI